MTEREKRIEKMVLDGAECSHIAEWWNCERCKYSPCGARRTCENLVEKDYRKADEVYNEAYTSGKKDGIIDFVQTVIRCLKNEPYLHTWLREIAFCKFGVEVEE